MGWLNPNLLIFDIPWDDDFGGLLAIIHYAKVFFKGEAGSSLYKCRSIRSQQHSFSPLVSFARMYSQNFHKSCLLLIECSLVLVCYMCNGSVGVSQRVFMWPYTLEMDRVYIEKSPLASSFAFPFEVFYSLSCPSCIYFSSSAPVCSVPYSVWSTQPLHNIGILSAFPSKHAMIVVHVGYFSGGWAVLQHGLSRLLPHWFWLARTCILPNIY